MFLLIVFVLYFFRFCVGDRFFLCDNKILCEYDYEERMVFANLAYNSNNLAQLKQQARGAINGHPGMNKVKILVKQILVKQILVKQILVKQILVKQILAKQILFKQILKTNPDKQILLKQILKKQTLAKQILANQILLKKFW